MEKFTTGPGLLACFPVGSLVLVVSSYLLAILAHFWPFVLLLGSFALIVLAIANILGHLWAHRNTLRFNPIADTLILAVFLLLLVRLSFLARILMPPYSDSGIHYQAILEVLGRNQELLQKSLLVTAIRIMKWSMMDYHVLSPLPSFLSRPVSKN